MGTEVVSFKTSVGPGSCPVQKPPKTAFAIKTPAEAVSFFISVGVSPSHLFSSEGCEMQSQNMPLGKDNEQKVSLSTYVDKLQTFILNRICILGLVCLGLLLIWRNDFLLS